MGTLIGTELPQRGASPLEAFSGSIHRTTTGFLYSAGLAVVALAMVLLPLIYIGLIGFTVWGIFLHLTSNTWILQGGSHGGSARGGLGRLLLFLGPAAVGLILVFFMVKPFLASKPKAPDPITLDPESEPLLFAFVRKICGLVGAPIPSRVDVDCQVNASASLRRGLWSRQLVLTIGLPLASGLTMRQFAGVLAHEFGHFAQGAGMRLTYIIRTINFWFARVVFERDEWDLRLEQLARGIDFRLAIVLHLARGCVWVTRRILWALMHVGHAISCFMLRQMEYDADSYEAKVAGSDAFEQTASRLRLLNVATQFAYQDVQQSWTSKRLPENLPLLIGHKAGTLPADVQQKLAGAVAEEKTRWSHTHPCDSDRIREARRLNEPGVFRLEEPASALFSNFAALSKTVTRHQYAKHMELEFSDENLMSSEEILRESQANAEAQAMVEKYYGKVDLSLKPLLAGGELPPIAPTENLLENWRAARETTESLRTKAEEISRECVQLQNRLADLTAGQYLCRAGFRLEPATSGLPGSATTPGEQQKAAVIEGQRTSIAITRQLAALDPFIEALRARITSALRLGQSRPEIGGSSTPTELRDLCFLTAAVGAEMPRAHELGTRLKTFVLLARSRGDDSNVAQVDETAAVLAGELRLIIARIQDRLKQFPYPFPHARGPLSVADYARYEQPPENEWDVYLDANAHVERLFSLNYRLLGRVLAFAHAVETRLSDPDGTKGDGSGAVNGATEAQETEQRSAIG